MKADLLFKRLTGQGKSNKLNASRPSTSKFSSSFSVDPDAEQKRKQLSALNRMDFDTFLIALADIANELYEAEQEVDSLGALIDNHLISVDEEI